MAGMETRRRISNLTVGLALLAAGSAGASASSLDSGLVTALDRVGGNLLGSAAFDAVLADPPDLIAPSTLRLHLSPVQERPVEVVLTVPGGTDPPEPIRAFFRLTVGPAGVRLEHDPTAGDIIPCIVPADLSDLAAAPFDGGNGEARFTPGLIAALAAVGEDLLGSGAFDAVLASPPEPIAPAPLRILLSWRQTSPLEIVLNSPPDPIFLRLPLGGEELVIEHDAGAGGAGRHLEIETADLSGLLGER